MTAEENLVVDDESVVDEELFDLSDFDTVAGSEKGAKCYLVHPLTQADLVIGGERIWISLFGPDSEAYIKESNRIANKRLNIARKNGVSTAESIQQENKMLVAKMITGWHQKFGYKKKILPFNKENAIFVVNNIPWVYDQLNAFLGERANFIAD